MLLERSGDTVKWKGHTLFLGEGREDLDFLPIRSVLQSDGYCSTILRYLLRDRPNPYVVDLGANVGSFVVLAKHFWPGSRVEAVEPHPTTCALLRRAVAENGFADVRVHEAGVSYDEGELILMESVSLQGQVLPAANMVWRADRATDAILKTRQELGRTFRPGKSVPLVTLEKIAEGYDGPIDLVKIDCEGAEWSVFRELSPQLAQRVNVIAGECHFGEPWGGGTLDGFTQLFKKCFPGRPFAMQQATSHTSHFFSCLDPDLAEEAMNNTRRDWHRVVELGHLQNQFNAAAAQIKAEYAKVVDDVRRQSLFEIERLKASHQHELERLQSRKGK